MKKQLLRAFGLVAVLFLSTFAVRAQTGWVYQGCWTPRVYGPCYDIYSDASGNYWLCKACGTTTNPSPTTCGQVFPNSFGYWCS